MAVKSLVSNRKTSISLMFCAALVVSGCDENGEFMFPQTGQAATNETAPVAGQNVQMVERDVEAPDAFQVSEDGLWDGRPSLGGVWVAHPDVSEPERVIIRNQANGTFVIGALFRRERENPGPALQVSSEAAAALEMLAGAPSELEVTALRREEVSETPVVEPVVEFEPPSGIVAAPIDAAPVDATPIDAAPIDVTPAMAPNTETASVDADASVELPRLIIPDPIAAAAAAIDAAEAEMAPIPAPAAAPQRQQTECALQALCPLCWPKKAKAGPSGVSSLAPLPPRQNVPSCCALSKPMVLRTRIS